MPTIFAHALVPLALRVAFGRAAVPPRLLAAGALAAVAPDFDSIGFALGIAYADAFGHRGASHSLAFAVAVGVLGALAARWLGTTRWRAFVVLAFCTASHPLLDALTNGGLGVALLWPWSEARLFAPWRPIAVSPIGAGFFSLRGVAVLGSELVWVVAPLGALAMTGWALRRAHPVTRARQLGATKSILALFLVSFAVACRSPGALQSTPAYSPPSRAIVLRVEVVEVEFTDWPLSCIAISEDCIPFYYWYRYRARVKDVVSGAWVGAEVEFTHAQHAEYIPAVTKDCYVVLLPAEDELSAKIGVSLVAERLLSRYWAPDRSIIDALRNRD